MAVLKTWTKTVAGSGPLESAFAESTSMLSGVSDSIVLDQLQLPSITVPTALPFLHVPQSATGTMRRFRSDTLAQVGDYRTAPLGYNRDCGRTSVDPFGAAWIGNRAAGLGGSGPLGVGSAVKVGLIVGGTRVNSDGTPNASGEYLAPPYQYSTVAPHSHNMTGFIRTSRAFNNVLAWTNTVPGVANADDALDDAIQLYVEGGSQETRNVTVDANGDVWIAGQNIAGFGPCVFAKFDGLTGALLRTEASTLNRGGHGGFIHPNGMIYSTDFGANRLVRFDPSLTGAAAFTSIGVNQVHNICCDRDGNVWAVNFLGELRKYDANLNAIGGPFVNGAVGATQRGVVCTFADNHIWTVSTDTINPIVSRWNSSGALQASISPTHGFQGGRGMAVDAAGKVWFCAMSNLVMVRLDPATGLSDASVGVGASTYPYSDFSGVSANTIQGPNGVWTAVYDGGSLKQFARTSWTEEIQAGTTLTVRQRFANAQIDLASQPWITAVNGATYGRTRARFAEVQVIFTRPFGAAETPILFDLSLEDLEPPMIVVDTDCKGYIAQAGAEQFALATAGHEAGCIAAVGSKS